MLRDKIVVGVADHRLRQQLLSDAKLTLQKVLIHVGHTKDGEDKGKGRQSKATRARYQNYPQFLLWRKSSKQEGTLPSLWQKVSCVQQTEPLCLGLQATREPTRWENMSPRPIDGAVRETPEERWTDQEEQLFQLNTNTKNRWITDLVMGEQGHVDKHDYGLEYPNTREDKVLTLQVVDNRTEAINIGRKWETENELGPHEINKVLRRAHFVIPTIEEILLELTDAKVFSVLDVKRGILAYATGEDSIRLILGTRWQRAMIKTLRGLKGVAVIADDIFVYGRGHSEEAARVEYDQNLECLLQRAQASSNRGANHLSELSKLQQYDITAKYKKGKELYLADTMSRTPIQEDLHQVHDSDQEFIMQLQNISMHQYLNVFNKQYLILTNYYSDYLEVDALPSTDSTAINKVTKVQFARHGIPTTLITDNATCFTSTEFQAFSRTSDFQQSTSSPYHLQGNGKAEAYVKIEHHEEMSTNQARPVAHITGVAQHPHDRFEDISSATTYVNENKNTNAYTNWASKTYQQQLTVVHFGPYTFLCRKALPAT
ncbi:hypothetical protein PR048_022949 [Dryococelus australis]|uniref:Integrase catalytic domain-containing protein n=1 Tax=Dryococelus australis TaxID=614101 RepID=A0ABQ9GSQ3_9NEOP|nr:hypothetical protein PR048_022949 [Dryococelus australis]